MAARVYNGVCLTDEQLDSLAAVGITEDEIVDSSCESGTGNSCGKTPSELLSLYESYDPAKGVYTKWGEIPFPWGTEEHPWGSAQYTDEFSYREGNRVVLIVNDGSILVLYEALQDLPVPPGPFDGDYWTEVCRIGVQDGQSSLPTITDLESQYDYWDRDEIPYDSNSTVLKYSPCGDYTCVHVARISTSDSPPSSDWSKLYCVRNGRPNLCTEPEKCLGKVVYLSAPYSDRICVPVESTTGQRSDP